MVSDNIDTSREIKVAVQKLAGRYNTDKVSIAECEVISVDINNRTCTCKAINDTSMATYEGVRLQSVVDDGFIIVPSIGSIVVVLYSIRILPLIVMNSEIEQVYMVSPKFQFNDGKLGGLVKVNDLKTQLNTLQTEINTLKTLVGTAISVYSGILDGGASAATFNAAQLPQIDLTNLENKKIIQ